MNQLEAMKQALEALEEYQRKGAPFLSCDAAADALRQAIKQAEQEQKWIETNNQVCALLRQAHDVLALSSLPPKRQPLTDDPIEEIDRWIEFKESGSGRIPTAKLVRYIEEKLKGGA